MPRIKERIDVSAPPSDVFRFCHDFDRRPEWDERISAIEVLSSGPVRRGTLMSIDACRGGEYVFSWDAELADYSFPHSSTLRVVTVARSSPFRDGSEQWTFDKANGGTRVTVVWAYEARGLLARLAGALWRRAGTRRDIRRTLNNLKQAVEAG
ncbi:MAG TPA: hypothetical protein ENN19_14135 [Chloroflexi bacterium]|nr:hypothetical protein [Chloroflexota bacterium]